MYYTFEVHNIYINIPKWKIKHELVNNMNLILTLSRGSSSRQYRVHVILYVTLQMPQPSSKCALVTILFDRAISRHFPALTANLEHIDSLKKNYIICYIIFVVQCQKFSSLPFFDMTSVILEMFHENYSGFAISKKRKKE